MTCRHAKLTEQEARECLNEHNKVERRKVCAVECPKCKFWHLVRIEPTRWLWELAR